MIAYPKLQKHAQDELDAVVGRSRPPTFADAPNLPFMQAVAKESLRWRRVGPFALPHRTAKDDWYEGMFIPKGTVCMENLWQCHLILRLTAMMRRTSIQRGSRMGAVGRSRVLGKRVLTGTERTDLGGGNALANTRPTTRCSSIWPRYSGLLGWNASVMKVGVRCRSIQKLQSILE